MSKNVNITISADSSDVKKAVSSANSSLGTLGKSAKSAGDEVGGSFKGIGVMGVALGSMIGSGLGKAFSMLTDNVGASIERLDTLNNFPKVMSNLGISTDDAQKSINVLSDKLQGLPTTLTDGALAVQRLTAANGDIKASTAMFLAMNDAILAGGAPMELQSSAMEQMSQAYAKGKPDAMEWRSMLSAMPAQMKQVATAMGFTSTAIGGDMQTAMVQGKISMNDMMGKIMELDQKGLPGLESFSEQAKNSTGGVGTSLINLKNAFVRMGTGIMDAIGQTNIAGFFQMITNAIAWAIPYVAAFVKVIMTAINAVIALFGGKAASSAKGTQNALQGAGTAAGGVAQNAGDTANNLGSANKQAKALQKTLAGFDEMTVIKDPNENSDGGGAGVGGGGGAGVPDMSGMNFDDIWNSMGKGNDKAQEIADGIIKTFADAWKVIQSTASWQGFANGIKAIFQALVSNISSIWNSLTSIFSDLAKAAFNTWDKFGADIDSALGGYFQSVGNNIASQINFWFAPITGFLDGLSKSVSEHAQSMTDSLAAIFVPAVDAAANFQNNMATMFDTITPYVQAGFSNLGQLFGNFVNDMLVAISTNAPAIGASFQTLTDGIFQTLTSFGVLAGTVWEDTTKTLLDTWNKYGAGIAQGVSDLIKNLMETFQRLWTDVLEPIIKPFLDNLVQTWKDHIKPMVDEIAQFVAKLVQFALDIYNKFINPIVQFLITVLGPAFVAIGNTIGNVFNTVLGVIGDVVGGIFKILSGIIDFISGVFSGNWSKAWDGVKSIFSGFAQAIGGIFKAPINFIIDGINGFISGLNSIKIPDWVPAIGGKGFNIPKIPKLARGGVVDNATLAMVGEAGKEAVMPLENNTGWIADLAQQINEHNNTNGDGSPISLEVKIGEDTILKKVIEGINERTSMTGLNAIMV